MAAFVNPEPIFEPKFESIIQYSINGAKTESLIGLSVGDKVYLKESGKIKKNDNDNTFTIEEVTTLITQITNVDDKKYTLTNMTDNQNIGTSIELKHNNDE